MLIQKVLVILSAVLVITVLGSYFAFRSTVDVEEDVPMHMADLLAKSAEDSQ